MSSIVDISSAAVQAVDVPTASVTAAVTADAAVSDLANDTDNLSLVDAGRPERAARKTVSLNARQTNQSHLRADKKFDDPDMKIPLPILEALTIDMGFVMPSVIQGLTIPRIMVKRNIIAQAQTGSGKTVAFTIGMLSCVDLSQNTVQAICLTPTRELAQQIANEAVIPLARRMPGFKCELILKEEQGQATQYTGVCDAHVVVGTPGTIIRLMRTPYLRNINKTVKMLVCDEADEMVEERELGSYTMQIKNYLNPAIQTLLFSATFPKEVVDYCHRIVKKASIITIENKEEMVLDTIFQVRLDVNRAPAEYTTVDDKKLFSLKELYTHLSIEQSMIFAETKVQVEQIATLLRNDQYTVSFMHGGLSGAERDEEVRKFKAGATKVLIATNVLSKGLDVPAVDLVVNYSLPLKFETKKADPITYYHRIGRCGRFGRAGTSVTFLCDAADNEKMLYIEKYFGYDDSRRMTHVWNADNIRALGDSITDIVENTAFAPVVADQNVAVDDAAYDAKA